jgi:hypothetical protein
LVRARDEAPHARAVPARGVLLRPAEEDSMSWPYWYVVLFAAGFITWGIAYGRGMRNGYYLALDHAKQRAHHDRVWKRAPRTVDEIVEELRNEPW